MNAPSRPLLLLVDDDDILRESLEDSARRTGFQVVTAANGAEALALVRHTAPDIIITDLHMPRMNGLSLIPQLRERPELAERPIIVLSADESRAAKVQALNNGADDFILKPVDLDEFQARILAIARRCNLVRTLSLVRQERQDALQALRGRSQELEQLTFGLISALEKANSMNDTDTGNHIRRVSAYARMLARVAGCDEDFVDQIYRYASLHDVGKVGIPDAILKKPGKLTPEEFDEMKTHTLIGAELLRSAGLPRVAVNVALHHHERWDGTGYPRGLAGEAIPLEARIVTVVDIFDALRSERCYKPAFSYEKSAGILRESAGTQLEPRLVELFLAQEEEIHRIAAQFSDENPAALEAAWV